MSQLSAMYDEARRLAVEVRITLDKIESSEASARLGMGVAGMSAHGWGPHTADTGLRRTAHGASTSAGVDGMAQEARAKLEALSKISAEMERSWRQQVLSEPQDRRNIWKHKVEQMAEDVSSLKGGFESAMGRRGRRLMEERERAELFNRVDVTGEAERTRRDFDVEGQMMESVTNSKRVLAEALGTGAAVLESMGATKERLKGAQRKALDVIHSLGLSDGILKLIERRHTRDKIIVYGGMVLVFVICVWLLWRTIM